MTNKEHAEIVQQAVSDITEQVFVARRAFCVLQDNVKLWIVVSCLLSASVTVLLAKVLGAIF